MFILPNVKQTGVMFILPNVKQTGVMFILPNVKQTGVALTFEKLRIANAQHGNNCVSSPAAKATISTDLPKIDKHENSLSNELRPVAF